VQNHVQQGIMNFPFSVVIDKTQFAEFVHKRARPRSGRADHLRQAAMGRIGYSTAFYGEPRPSDAVEGYPQECPPK
jgi:hypothetical protein